MPKKRKISENPDEIQVENDQNTAVDDENQEKPAKKLKPFDVKVFRKSLKGNDFIFEIKRFTRIASEDPTIIHTYLGSKGTVLELVEALLRLDQKNIFHISHVIDAITVILLEVVNNPEFVTSAIAGISFLLNGNRSIVLKLLTSDQETHRNSALKVLTGANVLNSQQFGLLSMRLMDTLVGEGGLETTIFKGFKLNEENLEDNVRKSYIQYILSLLIDTEVTLVGQLLQREYLVQGLMRGLVYDDTRDIAVILATIKERVLERPGILKTQKKRAFNEETVKYLIDVYNKWKGPQFLIHHKANLVSEDDARAAAEIVHEFCKILLCSRKYGIAFNALGKENKKNISQTLALRHLKFFWNHEQMSELVHALIHACPELIRILMDRIAIGIRPKMNEQWFNCVLFTQNLLAEVDPKPILTAVKHLDPKRVSEYILNFSICQSILQHIDENALLKGNVVEITVQLIKLLAVMLQKCSLFLTTYANMENILDYDLRKVKFNVINQIFAYFPSIETLLNALHTSIKVSRNEKTSEIRTQLSTTLDIILLLHEMVPSVITQSKDIVNYINVLNPIYTYHNDTIFEETPETRHEKLEVNLKIVKLMLILEPDVFQQKSELFKPVLETLIKVYTAAGGVSDTLQHESLQLLQKILNKQMFDETFVETNALILALKQTQVKYHPDIMDFLIEVMGNGSKDEGKDEILNEFSSVRDLKLIFEKIDKMDMIPVVEVNEKLEVGGVISLMLPKMLKYYESLEMNRQKTIKKFLENFALGLFFAVPDHKTISTGLKSSNLSIVPYINAFTCPDTPRLSAHPKIKPPSLVTEFIDSILTKTQLNDEFFSEESIMTCPLQIIQLIQIIVFCVVELTNRNSFDENHRVICTNYSRKLMQELKILEDKYLEVKGAELEATSDEKTLTNSCSAWLLHYIFVDQYPILTLFSLNCTSPTVKFISDLAQDLNGMFPGCGKYMEYFRRKIVMEVKEIISEKNVRNEEEHDRLLQTLDAFDLESKESLEILTKMLETKLKKVHDRSLLVKLIVFCVKILSESKTMSLDEGNVSKLGSLVTQIDPSDTLLETLFEYLNEFPHNIKHLPSNFMSGLVNNETLNVSKSLSRLLGLILERDVRYHATFPSILEEIYLKKELTYPLLRVAFKHNFINEQRDKVLLGKIYTEYKNGISKTIEKPLKVGAIYRENALSSIQLINYCMPVNECVDFANKTLKVQEAELVQFQLVQTIYWKAWRSLEGDDEETFTKRNEIFINFINNFLSLCNILLKKDHNESSIIPFVAYILERWLSLRDNNALNFDCETITTTNTWSTFVKNSIRAGLSTKNSHGDIILRQLSTLIELLYADDSSTEVLRDHFESFINHPAYFDFVLGNTNSPLKESIFFLTFTFIKKGPGLALEKHIPVYLGAYQASLSKTDQFILALLQIYERTKISFSKFRPLIWGEAAILRHSLRAGDDKSDTLNKKSGYLETLNLFEESIVRESFVKYPVWRKLDAVSQTPKMTIVVDRGCEMLLEGELIQKFVERDEKSEITMRSYFESKVGQEEDFSDIYDPAFIIPLVSSIFAPEQVDLTSVAVQKGLVSLLFGALSSQDLHMRLAVGQALIRCRSHLDGGKHFLGKELWQRMYDSVQNGLHSLCKLNSSSKTLPRPSTYATQFIGHSATVFPHALHDLYHALSNYFVVKPIFDFTSVPDFFNLFFNSDVKFAKHRNFLLTILADGTKTVDDFMSLFKSPILKLLMSAYGSPLTDTETNINIMNVFKSITKLPLATDVLIVKCGFLTWFQTVIERTETWFFDTIVVIIETLSNLYASVRRSKSSYKRPEEIEIQVLAVILTLLGKLTVKVPKTAVRKFLEVLYGITDDYMSLMPESSVKCLIEFAKIVLSEDFQRKLEKIEVHKGELSESWMDFVQKIDKTDDDQQEMFLYTREICIKWYKVNHK